MASVTSTYARAFTDVVIDKRLDPEKTLEQAKSLATLVAGSRELRVVWENPSIPTDQKVRLLDGIAQRLSISPAVRNFVAVLIDHRRVQFLDAIVRQFEKDVNERLGFAEAAVTSARDLGQEERRALETRLELLTGKKIRARYVRESSLLGGVIVQVGSTIYDGSVAGQLERIRVQLAESSR
ncbi:MAG TPA: ATP synthase F1 subunit delta [Terriglobales bacterium]|nr:ATP synthase F1 subunit delta [Terriglobales bacterium]